MDLKALFHNPESLTDEELQHLSRKINIQRTMPWTSAFFGGFGLYLIDTGVLRRGSCNRRIAAGAAVGFVLGAWGASQTSTTITRITNEADILNAFEKRYMTTVLNATGYGSNYVSSKDYSDTTAFKKPY